VLQPATSVAVNTLISEIENFAPIHECGPNENVITFASPGFAGGRAIAGSEAKWSGLHNIHQNHTTKRSKQHALEFFRIRSPYLGWICVHPPV
jgi:hypothetical protein